MQITSEPVSGRESKQVPSLGSDALEPWIEMMVRGNAEMFSLAARRAQAYMELPARLGACHSTQDLMGEQMRFWQAAMRHYSESAERVMTACSCAAATALPAALPTLPGAPAHSAGEQEPSGPQVRERRPRQKNGEEDRRTDH